MTRPHLASSGLVRNNRQTGNGRARGPTFTSARKESAGRLNFTLTAGRTSS